MSIEKYNTGGSAETRRIENVVSRVGLPQIVSCQFAVMIIRENIERKYAVGCYAPFV